MSATADAGLIGTVDEIAGPESGSVAGSWKPEATTTRPPAMTAESSMTAETSLVVPESAVDATKVPSTTPSLIETTFGSAGLIVPPM